MQNFIVLQDSAGEYLDGDIVNGVVGNIISHREGSIVIPVNPEIMQKHSSAGFFKRAYGKGLSLEEVSPSRLAPSHLYLVKGERTNTIHWCARLVSDHKYEETTGALRLIIDTAVPMSMAAGLSTSEDNAVRLDLLGNEDSTGGWLIRGSAPIAMPGDGPMSFTLWGAGRGVKVQWLAVSQA